jgi:hypothetical protein
MKNKKKNNDVYLVVFLGFFALFYLLPSLICFMNGLLNANNPPLWNNCDTKWSKIEYVYPAYRLGCYLGKNEE